VAVFAVIWFIVLIPTIELRVFLQDLKRPACFLPIAFFALAIVGTSWADVPWSSRYHGISPVAKLVAIPFLLYHFERSHRGVWVFAAFLFSCLLLLGLSWIVWFAPEWKIGTTVVAGVPLKNSIDQSQEFALCTFVLASLSLRFYKKRRLLLAGCSAALMLSFFCNLMFVVLARTALVYMLVLTVLFAVQHFKRRAIILFLAGAGVAGALVWSTSPYLRGRVENVAVEYREHSATNKPTSTGLRLEYWRVSMHAIARAPLFGNGTGSTRHLFDRNTATDPSAWTESIRNPHNQTFYVAVEWGAFGCIVLFAMWCFHFLLFNDESFVAWIGLVVVVQNIVSSLFNSHLFDFHEGWIYVLGVGVAGGLTTRAMNALPPLATRQQTSPVVRSVPTSVVVV
jgi:hypothetical protein